MGQRYLAIETSSPRLSLAVGDDTRCLREYQGPLAWRHAESLFEGLQSLLAKVHWPVKSLTGVAVSIGPGSFTGIRIGLATARTLGQALRIPVVGVSSLETLAQGAARPGKFLCPMLDALRGDVFAALYRVGPKGDLKTLWRPHRLPRKDLEDKLRAHPQPVLRICEDKHPNAQNLLLLARKHLHRSGPLSYRQVVPLYLRAAAAQERRHYARHHAIHA